MEINRITWNGSNVVRHWSPNQGYATGDVLGQLITEGWMVLNYEVKLNGHAPIYELTLTREERSMMLKVLDCPLVRDVTASAVPA